MRIKITLSLFCAVVTALCVLRPVVLAGGGGKKDPPKRSGCWTPRRPATRQRQLLLQTELPVQTELVVEAGT